MKDSSIFVLLLFVFGLSSLIALKNTSRTATVRGTFAPEFSHVDWKWAYLHPADSEEILDSCLVTEHKFTLRSDIPEKDYPCRISFSQLPIVSALCLDPGQTLDLNISVGMQQELTEQYEEAIREAIARLDSAGLTIPDSLWEAKNPRSDKKKTEGKNHISRPNVRPPSR